VDLEDPGVEALFLEVTLKSKLSFLLIVAYVSPEKHLDQLVKLTQIIGNLAHKNLVITGDLNAKTRAWSGGTSITIRMGESWKSFSTRKI
jgi:hypothetical protein